MVINAALRASDRIFDPNCAGLFLSPGANTLEQRQVLSQQFQYVADNNYYHLITAQAAGVGPNTGAFVSPDETTNVMGGIFVITGGLFFTGQINGHPAVAGLTVSQIQELVVIHEMLHWEGAVGPDDNGQQYTLANGDKVTGSDGVTKEVLKDCFH